MVKNITDYGALVDLGGVDGLLHVTDIAWRRINHPSEALQIGQHVKVQVIRFNPETQRISLGMKQLQTDPWEGVGAKYPVGARFKGKLTNVTDYGAFVELEPGVEGLVHVSEMSWVKKNVHPNKIVTPGQEVAVMVLEVDSNKRRISLGLKQCFDNPWESFRDKFPAGTELDGEVKNITDYGAFVDLGGIDGLLHVTDMSYKRVNHPNEVINIGDTVKVQMALVRPVHDVGPVRRGPGLERARRARAVPALALPAAGRPGGGPGPVGLDWLHRVDMTLPGEPSARPR